MGDTAARPDRPCACQRRRRSGVGGELSMTGDDAGLIRPCWDCGRRTGSWCDGGTATGRCSALAVCPAEQWEQGQATPLCTTCHGRAISCIVWVRMSGRDLSGILPSLPSRSNSGCRRPISEWCQISYPKCKSHCELGRPRLLTDLPVTLRDSVLKEWHLWIYASIALSMQRREMAYPLHNERS